MPLFIRLKIGKGKRERQNSKKYIVKFEYLDFIADYILLIQIIYSNSVATRYRTFNEKHKNDRKRRNM